MPLLRLLSSEEALSTTAQRNSSQRSTNRSSSSWKHFIAKYAPSS